METPEHITASLVNERKFTAHCLDTDRALAIIGHNCALDPLHPAGVVNSVYFETPQLSAFKEKIEGDVQKRKYRLRWYNVEGVDACDELTAYLEIKYRYGSARDKARKAIRVNRSWIESASPADPEWSRLIGREAARCGENYPLNLRPALCVSYQRRRFVCRTTGLMVCVDSDIQASRINPWLFCSTAPFNLQTVVCEFKGRGFRDIPWAKLLYNAGFRIRSFSKYGECINQILLGGSPAVIRLSI